MRAPVAVGEVHPGSTVRLSMAAGLPLRGKLHAFYGVLDPAPVNCLLEAGLGLRIHGLPLTSCLRYFEHVAEKLRIS